MAPSLFGGQHQMLYTMWVCHFVTIDFQTLKGSTHSIFCRGETRPKFRWWLDQGATFFISHVLGDSSKNVLLNDGGGKSVKERPREREMSKPGWYDALITFQIPLQMETNFLWWSDWPRVNTKWKHKNWTAKAVKSVLLHIERRLCHATWSFRNNIFRHGSTSLSSQHSGGRGKTGSLRQAWATSWGQD